MKKDADELIRSIHLSLVHQYINKLAHQHINLYPFNNRCNAHAASNAEGNQSGLFIGSFQFI